MSADSEFNDECIDEQTITELDNIINDDEPAPLEEQTENEVEPEIEISTKLKTRTDYIQTIKDVCGKLGKDTPKALHRKKLKDLKKILASITTEGINKASGVEMPPNNRDDYAVIMLYNLNKFVLNMASSVSYNYKNKLGFVCKDPVGKLERNEEQKEALKIALRGVWDEYKDDLAPYMTPVATLMIVNFTILTSSMERVEATFEKTTFEKSCDKIEEKNITII